VDGCMGLLHRAGRNVAFKFVGETAARALMLVYFLLMARLLGEREFGVYSYLASVCSMLVFIADPGLHTWLVRSVSQRREDPGVVLGRVLPVKVAASVLYVSTLAVFFVAGTGSVAASAAVWVPAVVVALLTGWHEYLWSVCSAVERMDVEAQLKFLNKLAVLAAGLPVLVARRSLALTLLAMGAASAVTLVFGFARTARLVPGIRVSWSSGSWRAVVSAALPLALNAVFLGLFFRVDMVVLAWAGVDVAEIGRYGASMRMVDTAGIVPFLIMSGVFPILAGLHAGDPAKLAETYGRLFKVLLVMGLGMCAATTVLADKLLHALFGVGYVSAAPTLAVLVWVVLFMYLDYLTLNMLIATERSADAAISTGVCVPVSLGLNLLLIPRYGITGAAAAAVATQAVLFVLTYRFVSRQVSGAPGVVFILKAVAAAGAMATMLVWMHDYSLFVLVPAGAAVYAFAGYAVRLFSPEECDLLRRILVRRLDTA